MGDRWEDIEVSDAMVASIAAVIGQHIPCHGQLRDDLMEAESFMLLFFSPTGHYDVWDAEKEDAKLDELRRATRHLVSVETSLHPSVRTQLELASNYVLTVKGFRSRDRLPNLSTIFAVLPEMVERSIKAGKDEIRRGVSANRTNWLAVSLIDNCRAVWHVRTGDEAPSGSDLNLASPFGMFVQDIFDAIGMKAKPRSAMQAWNRVQSRDENT